TWRGESWGVGKCCSALGDGCVGDGCVRDGCVGDGCFGDGCVGDCCFGDGYVGDGCDAVAVVLLGECTNKGSGEGKGEDVILEGEVECSVTSSIVGNKAT
ncbi:hypothetical protein Tco_0555190, partial [Tanacetum coccineum]